MQLLILFALVGSGFCQFFLPNFIGGDHIHDFSFEYHRTHQLLVVRNRSKCYLVELSKDMQNTMSHHDSRVKMEDAIYAQIQAGTGVTKASSGSLVHDYHDMLGALECRHHDTYKVDYSGSSD